MSLNVQIKTILFSFLLGIIAYILKALFHKKIYSQNKMIKIGSSFIYIESLTIVFIKCSYIINDLNIHFYSIFFLVSGYFISFFLFKHCAT